MKELEDIVLCVSYELNGYDSIAFLKPEDFTDKANRAYFKLISENGGDIAKILHTAAKDKEAFKSHFIYLSQLPYRPDHQRIALKVLELSFERLFYDLLGKLSSKAESRLEREILTECQGGVIDHDIFDLSDSIIDYGGAHLSDYSIREIESFLEHRDKRVLEAKKIINES